MQNSNILKIVNRVYENMVSNWYYEDYNGWLKERQSEAKAGKLSFTCDMTSKYYKMFADKGETEK